jgi:hypothetical protein
MSKRASSSSPVEATTKRLKDEILQDSPMGDAFDEEIDEPQRSPPPAPIANERAKKEVAAVDDETVSFRKILNSVRKQSAMKVNSEESQFAEAFRKMNDELPAIDESGADLELLKQLQDEMSEGLPLVFPMQNAQLPWDVLNIMALPGNVVGNENEATIMKNYKFFLEMMKIVRDMEKEGQKVDDRTKVDLYKATSWYLASLIACVEIKPSFCAEMTKKQHVVLLETCPRTYEVYIQKSLKFRFNPSFNEKVEASKDNPMFLYDCCGIVLCKTKDYKKEGKVMRMSTVHPDAVDFLSRIFYDVAVQTIPALAKDVSTTVYFHVTSTQNTPHLNLLQADQLKKMDSDLHLAHVTISKGYLRPGYNNKLNMYVVMYVNYFVKPRF